MAGPMRASDVKPPRPQNSWILYRAYMMKHLPPVGPGEPRRSQSDVSTLIATMWRTATPDVRAKFERMADEVKAEHKRKFPDYKFQPKKKEEKDRLKVMQKEQRQNQKRDNRSRRGVERNSPAPAPAIIQPLPNIYYNPHTFYGSAGPSPPLSAASSPSAISDATSSPIPSLLQLSTPITTPSPMTSMPSLTLTTDTAPISQLPYQFQISQSSTSALGDDYSTWPSAQDLQMPPSTNAAAENASLASSWDPSSLSLDQNALAGPSAPVTFELPQNGLHTQGWNQFEDSQHIDPFSFLSSTPGLYEIQSLDQSALASDPTSHVEIEVGNIHRSDDVSTFLGASFFDPNLPSGSNLSSMNAEYTSAQESYDFTQFLNSFPFDLGDAPYNDISPLDASSSLGNASSSEHQLYTEPVSEPSETVSAPQATSYVPPSGAAYSSSRRVAGNWANSIFVNQPNDHASSPQELRAQ